MARKKTENLLEEIEAAEKRAFSSKKALLIFALLLVFLSVFFVSSLFGMGGKFGDSLFNFLVKAQTQTE